jgi:hypothetical protein
MPSADLCRPVRVAPATLSPLRDSRQISQGKTQNVWRVGAGFIKHTPWRMEDFAVTCPLVPGVPHLVSGSCASPRAFGLGFLQTPPHGDALALLLAFGSARTWREDFHLARSVPCLAHTGTPPAGCALGPARGPCLPSAQAERWVRIFPVCRARHRQVDHLGLLDEGEEPAWLM